jgi:hypothetical protein
MPEFRPQIEHLNTAIDSLPPLLVQLVGSLCDCVSLRDSGRATRPRVPRVQTVLEPGILYDEPSPSR